MLDVAGGLRAPVGALYDAAFDPARWASAVAAVVGPLGPHTRACVLLERRPADYLWILPVGVAAAAVAAYAGCYARLDPMLPALHDAPEGAVVDAAEEVRAGGAGARRAFARSAFYAGFARPHDVRACVVGMAWRTAEFVAKLCCVRGRGAPPFDATERALVGRVLPHLRRALETARRLAGRDAERGAILGALDALTDAVLLTDADAHVVGANEAAAALLRSGAALAVERFADGAAGRLRAARPADTAALRDQIAAAAATATAGDARVDDLPARTLCLARPGRGPLVVTVTPVRRRPLAVGPFARDPDSHDRRSPTAVVFVTDPEARPGPAVADRLRATYGLTSAEATVAVAVSRGTGLRAIAGDRGVALATVRTQLLRAYAKTGSQNQASLAGLVAQFGRAH
jgi:DNA-binding CsgD family transcriptional regulator/PAS domain-containing protein